MNRRLQRPEQTSSLVATRQTAHAKESSPFTGEGKPPRNEKDEDEDSKEKSWRRRGRLEKLRHMLGRI
jgi:hypothetical protein